VERPRGPRRAQRLEQVHAAADPRGLEPPAPKSLRLARRAARSEQGGFPRLDQDADRDRQTISDLVNDAVRQNLAEDAEDLTAYRERAKEPSLDSEKVLKDLRRRGKL
jgi:hypothetical protein